MADRCGYATSSRGRSTSHVDPRNKVVNVERYFLDGAFPTQPRIIENRPHHENARVMRVSDLLRIYVIVVEN